MTLLNLQIDELASYIPKMNSMNTEVSKGSIAWHIEHTLLTINAIIKQLPKSNPTAYKWQFKMSKFIVFTLNKIPTGRAKAPDVVTPKTEITLESLEQHIIKTREHLKSLETLSKDAYFDHPFFGHLKLKETIKFLGIHTNHHLGIIKKIIVTS